MSEFMPAIVGLLLALWQLAGLDSINHAHISSWSVTFYSSGMLVMLSSCTSSSWDDSVSKSSYKLISADQPLTFRPQKHAEFSWVKIGDFYSSIHSFS